MSDNTLDAPRTLDAVPVPQPLSGLTGAPAAIYTELAGRGDGPTVAELSLATGLGRSTTGKALTTLEKHGLAVRTPGGHDGPRRTPDRWHPAPSTPNTGGDDQNDPEATTTEPEPAAADTTEPINTTPARETAEAEETAPKEPTATADDDTAVTSNQPTDTPQIPSPTDTEQDNGTGTSEDGPRNTEDAPAEATSSPSPQDNTESPAPSAAATIPPSEKKRLAPGALRQLVVDHLEAHPGEAFTATKISRVIEKSSGAIANALDKLASQGIAEQVTDKPRTFRRTGTTHTA